MKYITKYVKNEDFSTTLINVIFQFKLSCDEILAHSMLARMLSKTNYKFKEEDNFYKEKMMRYIIRYNAIPQSINNVYFMNFSMLIPSKNIVNDDYLKEALEFLFDSVYNPNIEEGLFKEEDFQKEKRIYIENLLNGYKNINFVAEKNALELLDGDGIFNKIKYKDIDNIKFLENKDLVNFYSKYIKGIKPKVFINGNIDIDKCEDIICNILDSMKLKNQKLIKDYNYFYQGNDLIVKDDDSKFYQSVVYMTYKVNDYKYEDFYKLYLLNLILSSSASDILLDVLRKQNNLVYASGSSALIRNGILIIKAVTNNESVKLVKMLIEDIINNLKNIDNYKENISNIIYRLKLDLEREKDDFFIATSNIINEYFETHLSSEEEYKIISNITKEELLDLINRLKLVSVYTLEGNSD